MPDNLKKKNRNSVFRLKHSCLPQDDQHCCYYDLGDKLQQKYRCVYQKCTFRAQALRVTTGNPCPDLPHTGLSAAEEHVDLGMPGSASPPLMAPTRSAEQTLVFFPGCSDSRGLNRGLGSSIFNKHSRRLSSSSRDTS